MRITMNKISILTSMMLALVLAACDTQPKIIPDTTGDSAMILKIKDGINSGQLHSTSGYSWILWYIPILFLVIAWGWRELIAKKSVKQCDNCGYFVGSPIKSNQKKKKKKPQTAPSSPPSN